MEKQLKIIAQARWFSAYCFGTIVTITREDAERMVRAASDEICIKYWELNALTTGTAVVDKKFMDDGAVREIKPKWRRIPNYKKA